jgi:hypothetical protein
MASLESKLASLALEARAPLRMHDEKKRDADILVALDDVQEALRKARSHVRANMRRALRAKCLHPEEQRRVHCESDARGMFNVRYVGSCLRCGQGKLPPPLEYREGRSKSQARALERLAVAQGWNDVEALCNRVLSGDNDEETRAAVAARVLKEGL